jgi:ribose transport system substrate-binding protein
MVRLAGLAALVALMALMALPGCAGRKRTKGTIGVSVLTLTNPFFKVIGDTIKEEAAKHGFDVIVVSGDFDVAKQKNQVEDFIVRGVDAIVLCPCDSQAIAPVIQKANGEGIPVFTADIACLDKRAKVVCHIATDNKEGGRQAGQGMIEALAPGGGKVAILDFKQAESCLLRVEGFKARINEHNAGGGPLITIVMEIGGEGQKDRGYKAAEDVLQAVPDLAGIFAINDPSALGARAALERAGKAERVKIIGFDGQPDGKQAIREGKIYADPVQFPDRIGAKTAEAIAKHFAGERLPREILIETELYRGDDKGK